MIRVAPQFPPLIKGMAAGPANPLTIASAEAQRGTDAGLLVWSLTDDRMRAALVLAPETPLSHAASALVACGVGLQNALGVLVPPETAVHLEWAGGIRLNGGHAGGMRLYSSTRDADDIPDWMIVSLELTLRLPDKAEIEPGETPDWTALDQEGAGEVDAMDLLEGWSKHALLWLGELEHPNGLATLYREWRGLVWQLGEDTAVTLPGERIGGRFLGVDENFGMILKAGEDTRLIPLTTLAERV
jgi:hypothetical protein